MNNPNTEYEKLVAEIHQGMLKYDGFENLQVDHDVTLKGKSGATHQIDVFWEFKAAGTIYRTCVECKNYNSSVKKSHVASFAGILNDLGNANGIIATTSAFQKGAKQLAKENNIRLVLVNHLLKEIHLTFHPQTTDYKNFNFNFNRDSVKDALTRNNKKRYSGNWSATGEEPLFNEKGKIVSSLNTVLKKHSLKEGLNVIENINLYLHIEDLGPILLESFSMDVAFRELAPMKSIIKSSHSATAAIEDIVENNIHYLHKNGSVNQNLDT